MKRGQLSLTSILDGKEGSWETIASLIESQILPALDRQGILLFQPPNEPVPPDAQVAPISDFPRLWYRNTPQILFVLGGEEIVIYRQRLWRLRAPQGMVLGLREGESHVSHVILPNRPFIPRDCLWVDIFPFGVVVHRCELTAHSHRSSQHYMLIDTRLYELFSAWMEETQYMAKLSSNNLTVKGLLMAFWGLLAHSQLLPLRAVEHLPQDAQQLPAPLRRALYRLHRLYNRPFNLKQLAKESGVSPYHLCRLFKKHLGVTPWIYFTHLRLNAACKLLKTTNLSVSEIASLLGYATPAHFTRQFTSHFGIPPKSFRHQSAER